MTDEQLRAMARRVLGLVSEVVLDGRPCYVGYRDSLSFTRPIEEVDAEAVAILREEMAKAELAEIAKRVPSMEQLHAAFGDPETQKQILREWTSEPSWETDPTQSVSIDT